MKRLIFAAALVVSPAFAATPTDWTTTIDAATHGSSGTVVFNDWGYEGPMGVRANDFQVGSGFDASRIGQIQTVVTKDPDGLTPDAPKRIVGDYGSSERFPNANMDGQVNFYKWGYTTVGGSTFNNMKIDKAGNYFVARNDMAFQYYDVFKYKDTTGTNPDQTFDTRLNFQPYAVSDARGWCGSVLTSSPDSFERMAGQVTFDFAFDVYFDGSITANGQDNFSSTQIVPDFVMRSYGSYTVNVALADGTVQSFSGSAVENNTNPLTGELDPAWHDQVSFLGSGVVPKGVWVLNDGTANVQVVTADTPGAVWHANSFAGYAFLLRADGTRILTYAANNWSDYMAPVPEPNAVWMFLAGLATLGALARRGAATPATC